MAKVFMYLTFSFILISCSGVEKMRMLKAENPTINDFETLNRGKVLYQNNCVRCHGEKGLGDGPDGKALSKKPTNLQIIANNKTANSIAANIKYGKGARMPVFKSLLSENQIWDIANYVNSWKKVKEAPRK